MKRLIERGLMFGNLIDISSTALVERYNRALKHLTGQTTALTEFHIDISGYSPEIGDELGDPLYLNHEGVNRQFILLTTDQRSAPLLNMKFSTARSILQRFIDENEAELFALTARDAVAGEMLNSVYSMQDPTQVLDIRQIDIEADTTDGAVRNATQLGTMIDQFKTTEDAWFDDVLIANMISLAKQTGDVTRNPVKLREMQFAQTNFWTSHFGGMYIFQSAEHPAVITGQPLDQRVSEYQFDLSQLNHIAVFLELNGLVEPIVKAPGIDAAAILQQKLEFIVARIAAENGEDLDRATSGRMRALARKYANKLPTEFQGLASMLRWASAGGAWPRITSDHPAYFYTLRASDTEDKDLVNMLLAELAPMDVLQLFIWHKDAFYRAYANWPDPMKSYTARFLEQHYGGDKARAREALYGHTETISRSGAPSEDMIARVGPWGAVKG